MQTHAHLIDALGIAEIAKATGQKPNTIGNWRKRGIAWKWRPAVASLAARKDIAVPPDFLPQPQVAA